MNFQFQLKFCTFSENKHQPQILGKPTSVILNHELWELLCRLLVASGQPAIKQDTKVNIFYRLSTTQCVYYSAGYKRLLKRNSTIIQYNCQHSWSYGGIKYFISHGSQMFAVICPYNKCPKPIAETLGLQGDEALTHASFAMCYIVRRHSNNFCNRYCV